MLECKQYTGQALDFEKQLLISNIKAFDLARAGNIKLELHKWQVDFAVSCTYKYLIQVLVCWCFHDEKKHKTNHLDLETW